MYAHVWIASDEDSKDSDNGDVDSAPESPESKRLRESRQGRMMSLTVIDEVSCPTSPSALSVTDRANSFRSDSRDSDTFIPITAARANSKDSAPHEAVHPDKSNRSEKTHSDNSSVNTPQSCRSTRSLKFTFDINDAVDSKDETNNEAPRQNSSNGKKKLRPSSISSECSSTCSIPLEFNVKKRQDDNNDSSSTAGSESGSESPESRRLRDTFQGRLVECHPSDSTQAPGGVSSGQSNGATHIQDSSIRDNPVSEKSKWLEKLRKQTSSREESVQVYSDDDDKDDTVAVSGDDTIKATGDNSRLSRLRNGEGIVQSGKTKYPRKLRLNVKDMINNPATSKQVQRPSLKTRKAPGPPAPIVIRTESWETPDDISTQLRRLPGSPDQHQEREVQDGSSRHRNHGPRVPQLASYLDSRDLNEVTKVELPPSSYCKYSRHWWR